MGAKLIRDLVPNQPWTNEETKKFLRKVESPQEYASLLISKLFEELGEMLGSQSEEESALEMVDVFTVMKKIVALHEGDPVFMDAVRAKLQSHGGFEEGWVWDRHMYLGE